MPTIDDLRAVLVARETHAGDADAVRQALIEAPARTRFVVPALAATGVVAVAAAVAVLAASSTGRPGNERAGGVPSASGAPGLSMSVAPATTAPPVPDTHLRWSFSVAAVPGYSITRYRYTPDSEAAIVRSTDGSGFSAAITVYHPVPNKPMPKSDVPVVVNSILGYFQGGSSTPYVVWPFGANSWAKIEEEAPRLGETRTSDDAVAKATLLQIARAVRFEQSAAVTAAFALHPLPSTLLLEAVAADPRSGAPSCVGYGQGDGYPSDTASLGTTLTICRTDAKHPSAGLTPDPRDRVVHRQLPDGTSIVVVLDHVHLDAFTTAQLQQLAGHIDVSPVLSRPSTWLPVE